MVRELSREPAMFHEDWMGGSGTDTRSVLQNGGFMKVCVCV